MVTLTNKMIMGKVKKYLKLQLGKPCPIDLEERQYYQRCIFGKVIQAEITPANVDQVIRDKVSSFCKKFL